MDKEKQIEELTEIIRPFVSSLACEEESGSCEFVNCQYCRARDIARKIYENDYQKQSENSVEVIHCCDCKYCEVVIDGIIDEPKYFCTRIVGSIPVDPTDYCSRAKMRGGE